MILNTLFGKRIYFTDSDLGKFYSEKKIKHNPPILWSTYTNILNQKEKTILQFQGTRTEIYPPIKSEFMYFLHHYRREYLPFLEEQIKEYKDLLSFDDLEFKFEEVYGIDDRNKPIIQFLAQEISHQYLVRFSLIDKKIRSLFIA